MSSTARRLLALFGVLALVVVPGCGGEEEPQPAEEPRETVDPLPKLRQGWKPYVNHRIGFAMGVAPGWSARETGTSTLLRSPDRLVAVSVSADRTDAALAVPLDEFAADAAAALDGYHDLDTD